jgi:hypothetical protein
MPREKELEGQPDMGGKHRGQAGIPKQEGRSSAQQGIARDEKGPGTADGQASGSTNLPVARLISLKDTPPGSKYGVPAAPCLRLSTKIPVASFFAMRVHRRMTRLPFMS